MQPPDEYLFLGELYSLGLRVHPSWATEFLEPRYCRSKGYQVLGHLRSLAKRAQMGEIGLEESYKTKTQLAESAFPQEWADLANKLEFEALGSLIVSPKRLYQKMLIARTGEAMRLVTKEMRDKLKNCRNAEERSSFVANDLEIFVRVGLTDSEEFLFGYHGLNIRQSPEILRVNWELMQIHSTKAACTNKLITWIGLLA